MVFPASMPVGCITSEAEVDCARAHVEVDAEVLAARPHILRAPRGEVITREHHLESLAHRRRGRAAFRLRLNPHALLAVVADHSSTTLFITNFSVATSQMRRRPSVAFEVESTSVKSINFVGGEDALDKTRITF